MEELEVSANNDHDSSTLDQSLGNGIQPVRENSEMEVAERKTLDTTEKRYIEDDVASTEDLNNDMQDRRLSNHNTELDDTANRSKSECDDSQENTGTDNMKQNTREETLSEEDLDVPEDLLQLSLDQSTKPEDIEERNLSLLKQWSDRQRSKSEGDANQMKLSFNSDDGDSEVNTYFGYINYGVDDDLLEDLTDPPHRIAQTHTREEAPYLDTIQESDESDEDEGEAKRITMPSTMNTNLSAGMYNLQDISSNGEDETGAMQEESENTSENSANCISIDLESNSNSSDDTEDLSQEKSTDTAVQSKRRLKKGKISDKCVSPVFLSEDVRTFSNPISYLGGPTIEYEEEEIGRKRNDSFTSTTSLD